MPQKQARRQPALKDIEKREIELLPPKA